MLSFKQTNEQKMMKERPNERHTESGVGKDRVGVFLLWGIPSLVDENDTLKNWQF